MITGTIIAGCGGASRISEDVFQARCRTAGVSLVLGTLNVKVANIESSVAALSAPHFETDRNNQRLGPLRWWAVRMLGEKLPVKGVEAFVVHHERIRTRYLEVMSDFDFRKISVANGDVIRIKLVDEQAADRKLPKG